MVLLGLGRCILQTARADTPSHQPASVFTQFGSVHGTRTLTVG